MNEEQTEGKCEMCEKNPEQEEHDCPYSIEMGGGDTCNCCSECTLCCRMDI